MLEPGLYAHLLELPVAPVEPIWKTRPFELESFVAWLETKDQNETYVWHDVTRCPQAQYCKALSLGYLNVSSEFHTRLHKKLAIRNHEFRFSHGPIYMMRYYPSSIAMPKVSTEGMREGKFGYALSRARELLAYVRTIA